MTTSKQNAIDLDLAQIRTGLRRCWGFLALALLSVASVGAVALARASGYTLAFVGGDALYLGLALAAAAFFASGQLLHRTVQTRIRHTQNLLQREKGVI